MYLDQIEAVFLTVFVMLVIGITELYVPHVINNAPPVREPQIAVKPVPMPLEILIQIVYVMMVILKLEM